MMRYLLILVLLFSGISSAEQVLNARDGKSYKIKISANELTRITVKGSGRIDRVWGVGGVLDVQANKEQGEVYVKPIGRKPHFSFFVEDDLGSVYTLVAQQYDIPAETVYINPMKKSAQGGDRETVGKNEAYVKRVKAMMEIMATADTSAAYIDFDRKVQLWKEVKVRYRRQYQAAGLLGDVYTVRNRSDVKQVFDEREFTGFGKDVKAVALENLILQPGEATRLFVVRGGK